jgi:hypothetical protein
MMVDTWVYTGLMITFDRLDPFTSLAAVILANSGGWANAWAYFHNKRIKEMSRVKRSIGTIELVPNVKGIKSYFFRKEIECKLTQFSLISKSEKY